MAPPDGKGADGGACALAALAEGLYRIVWSDSGPFTPAFRPVRPALVLACQPASLGRAVRLELPSRPLRRILEARRGCIIPGIARLHQHARCSTRHQQGADSSHHHQSYATPPPAPPAQAMSEPRVLRGASASWPPDHSSAVSWRPAPAMHQPPRLTSHQPPASSSILTPYSIGHQPPATSSSISTSHVSNRRRRGESGLTLALHHSESRCVCTPPRPRA
jgi:hypothetical protein